MARGLRVVRSVRHRQMGVMGLPNAGEESYGGVGFLSSWRAQSDGDLSMNPKCLVARSSHHEGGREWVYDSVHRYFFTPESVSE